MEITKFQSNQKEFTRLNALLLVVFSILFQPVLCTGTSPSRENTGINLTETEIPQFIYTEGYDLQQVIDKAPKHSTIICNRNRQLTIAVPIIINKPLTLKGLNARLPENLGKSAILEVKSKGVAITDFELRGNAATVSQSERAALIKVFFGDFRIERGFVENSSKEGIEVDPQEFPEPIEGGTIRDIVGRGCVRDVISLGGPAGPEQHVRNILLENISGYDSSLRGPVEVSDGCVNITVRKIYAENCLYAVDVQDHNKQEINSSVLITDVHAVRCTHAIRTRNHPNGHSNLTISNITAEQCKKTLYVSNTDLVTIQSVKIIGYAGEGPVMSAENCNFLTVRNIILIDCASRSEGLLVENCDNVTMDGVKLKNSGSLSSGVTYRISDDKIFSNLFISHVSGKGARDAGIVLEKMNKNAMLTDYIISNNIAKVADRIEGLNRIVVNNLD
ncbi:MAG: hypothetical protein ACOCVA_07720 [Prolixibacteraceae bacterium]